MKFSCFLPAVSPPTTVSDSVTHSSLMAVPLNVHPDEFGFDDFHNLISLCYEIRGTPGQIANLVSSECASVNAQYVRLGDNPAEITYGSIGIRAIDDNGRCNNIQVNRDCSVHYNQQTLSSNSSSNNVSVYIFSDSIHVTVPNCGKEIAVKLQCLNINGNPTINLTITRSYNDHVDTHGLIGKGKQTL